MDRPRIFQFDTGGRQFPVAVGDRVSFPTDASGRMDVVEDPESTHTIISYEAGLIEAERIDTP